MLQSVELAKFPCVGWTLGDLRRMLSFPVRLFLKPERVQEELQAMPGWRGVFAFRAIHRQRRFPTPELAGLYAAYVSTFAQEVGQFCAVVQNGRHVTLTLTGRHPSGHFGINRAVLDFAKRLG